MTKVDGLSSCLISGMRHFAPAPTVRRISPQVDKRPVFRHTGCGNLLKYTFSTRNTDYRPKGRGWVCRVTELVLLLNGIKGEYMRLLLWGTHVSAHLDEVDELRYELLEY